MARKQVIHATGMPKQIGVYSHAIRAGDLLFVSGQPGVDPETGAAPAEFTAQARHAFANLVTVLRAAGSGPEHVVQTTVYLADGSKFNELNDIFAATFPIDPPTRATPVVALPRGLLISVQCIAVMP